MVKCIVAYGGPMRCRCLPDVVCMCSAKSSRCRVRCCLIFSFDQRVRATGTLYLPMLRLDGCISVLSIDFARMCRV